jgi:hypothetical protein
LQAVAATGDTSLGAPMGSKRASGEEPSKGVGAAGGAGAAAGGGGARAPPCAESRVCVLCGADS